MKSTLSSVDFHLLYRSHSFEGYVLSEELAGKYRLKLTDMLLWVYLEFQGMCSTQESIPSVMNMLKVYAAKMQYQCHQSYDIREMHFLGSKNHAKYLISRWKTACHLVMLTKIHPGNQLYQATLMKHKMVGKFHKWKDKEIFYNVKFCSVPLSLRLPSLLSKCTNICK